MSLPSSNRSVVDAATYTINPGIAQAALKPIIAGLAPGDTLNINPGALSTLHMLEVAEDMRNLRGHLMA